MKQTDNRGSAPGERRGGRKPGTPNRTTREIKELAEPFGAEAIEVLARIMRDDNADPRTQVAAAKELLDRGYGRPTQAVTVDARVAVREMSDEDLHQQIKTLAAQIGLSVATLDDDPQGSA